MRKRKYTDEELRQAAASSTSVRGVLQKIGLVEAGGNYAVVKQRIALLQLDVSHFHGKGWRKGSSTPPKAAEEITTYLVSGRTCRSSHLRIRLIRENLKEAKCESCDRTEWLGQPIPLELEHTNGDKADNRLENLKLLCPNCHALTATYRGKNIGRV